MKEKYDQYKKELLHTHVEPVAVVSIEEDEKSFQGYAVKRLEDISFPLILGDGEIIIDFGDHYTGYLHIEVEGGTEGHIPDSPTVIEFSFAEMPIELMKEVKPASGMISVGWLQNDYKSIAFMPYAGNLERRYAFRYLRLRRRDSAYFDVKVKALYLDAVSAVRLEDAIPYTTRDELLAKIDSMCVKTLKECEQDVFEDGPKRDRRLWIGDLRLQALVDHYTFKNIDLVKRCIYLFAQHLNSQGLVAPCVFPDTPPYVDEWIYLDYSLCMVLCLSDYLENTGDMELPDELYEVAKHQVQYAESVFDRKRHMIDVPFFIDHGDYDRCIAALGYFGYTLCHMITLSEKLQKPTEWLQMLLQEVYSSILTYRDPKSGLFFTADGELSWQSQVWAVLSGVLSMEECRKLLSQTVVADPPVRMSSPFMTHYYLEALCSCKEFEKAIAYIKKYWGAIIDAGFDCCPECFDPKNEMVTPYKNPVLNSACHAWSCTPTYWIRKYRL